jgi:ribose transport system substrate-binding protein
VNTNRARFKALVTALGVVGALTLAACGSGSSDNTAAEADKVESGKVYVEGVPTLDELYKGSEHLPPTTGPAPKKGANVWWLSCGESIEGCSGPAAGGKEAAKAIGFEYHIADGKLNVGGGWSAGIRTATAAGADAIILFGISCPVVSQAVQEARDSGIVVMGVESDDCEYNGSSTNPAVKEFVDQYYSETMTSAIKGGFWGTYGKVAADYIINKSQGKAKLIINSGVETQTKAIDDGFRKEFAKCKGCEIVDTVKYASPDLGPNGAWINAFRTNIVKNTGKFNAVYFPFDGFAAAWGGVKALEDAGMADKVITFGGQGFPDSEEMVRQGRLDAITSARPAAWVGWGAIDQINRALNGEKRTPEGFGFTLLDKDKNLPKEGESWNGTVDWKDTYLKTWGVQQ